VPGTVASSFFQGSFPRLHISTSCLRVHQYKSVKSQIRRILIILKSLVFEAKPNPMPANNSLPETPGRCGRSSCTNHVEYEDKSNHNKNPQFLLPYIYKYIGSVRFESKDIKFMMIIRDEGENMILTDFVPAFNKETMDFYFHIIIIVKKKISVNKIWVRKESVPRFADTPEPYGRPDMQPC